MRRFVSLLVTLVVSAGGHALVFGSGAVLRRAADEGGAGIGAIPLTALGALLIGAAVLTAAWSSLGVIVVGALHATLGLAAIVLPAASGRGSNPVSVALGSLVEWGDAGNAALLWLITGAALIQGVAMVALGAAVARRRRREVRHPIGARVISLVVVTAGLGPTILLAAHGGQREYQREYQHAAGVDPLALTLLGVGLVLLALLAVTVRWSGLGAIVAGAVVTVVAGSLLTVPAFLAVADARRFDEDVTRTAVAGLPHEVAATVLATLAVGGALAVAAMFLFGGIASALAGRRARRRDSFVEPDASTGSRDAVRADVADRDETPWWRPAESRADRAATSRV